MKTVVLVLVSSLFLSNMPNNKANDSMKKIITYKIKATDGIKVDDFTNSRTPILIVKRD